MSNRDMKQTNQNYQSGLGNTSSTLTRGKLW